MNNLVDHLKQSRTLAPLLGVVIAGLFLLFPGQTQAQSAEDALLFSQRLPATGARSIGLAGAGKAGIGDYSAFYTNPAGLGWLKQSQISASLNFLSVENDIAAQFGGNNNLFLEEFTEQGLSNVGGVVKVPTQQGSLVLGGAYNQTNSFDRRLYFEGLNSGGSISSALLPFDDEFEVVDNGDGTFSPRFFANLPEIAYLGGAIEFLGENVGTGNGLFYEAVNPTTTIEQSGEVFQEGRMSDLSLGGAVEVARGVMVGASVNFSFGSYDFQGIVREDDINNENGQDDYVVIDGDAEFRGFNNLIFEENFVSDLVGANFRAGVSAMATDDLKIGLTVESPTFYRVDEQFDTIVSTEFDTGQILTYGDQPNDIGRGTFEYDVTTPWRFGAGLGYSLGDLTLMADVELVDWSQLEMDSDVDRGFFRDINNNIRRNFEAVLNTRFAGEYQLGDLTIRGGVGFNPDPVNVRQSSTDGASVDRDKTYLSAGVGYQFSNAFVIDFGWMQERQENLYQHGLLEYAVTEDIARNFFQVGVSVLF